MTRVKTKQIISVILALLILLSFSVISMPFAYAAGQGNCPSNNHG